MKEMAETAEDRTKKQGKIDGFTQDEAAALYEILGLGALKYFLLKVDPRKRMLFNPAESIEFQGNTGPFIQYTHARIKSLMRTAKQRDIGLTDIAYDQISELHETEKELINAISLYGEKLSAAAADYAPSVMAQYVYDLAKLYNRFYAEVKVLDSSDMVKCQFRVALSALTAQTIKFSMGLLGIDVPERM